MLPRYWRLSEQRYRLRGVQCPRCGRVFLAGHAVCCEHSRDDSRASDKAACAVSVAPEKYSLQVSACLWPGGLIRPRFQLGKL